jgi:hypothetical protein
MTVSQDEAARALDDIADARAQSQKFLGYRISSAYFFLWGVLWAIANGLSDFYPHLGGRIWSVTDIASIIASLFIAMRGGRPKDRRNRGGRYLAFIAIYLAFGYGVFAILPPVSGRQSYSFFVLLIAAIYMSMGLWRGLRFFIAGAVLFASTLAGYFLLPSHFFLWMGFIGGGTMILTGFWLRRI